MLFNTCHESKSSKRQESIEKSAKLKRCNSEQKAKKLSQVFLFKYCHVAD